MVAYMSSFLSSIARFITGLFNLTIPGTNFTFLGFLVLCFVIIFVGHIIKLMIGGE